MAFQHLVFPMLDERTVTRPDPSPYVGQFVWTPDSNRFGWASLLGGPPGAADVSPFAAPARATDLSGLPPTFMICGALDLFLEEVLDYEVTRHGAPVTGSSSRVPPIPIHSWNQGLSASFGSRVDSWRACGPSPRKVIL